MVESAQPVTPSSGKTLATGSTDDTVKFWNTATWQEVMTLPDYGKNVSRLMFSPDGSTLAVGSSFGDDDRGPVQLWRAPSWAEIAAAEVLAASKP